MSLSLTRARSRQLLVDTQVLNDDDPRAKEVAQWIQMLPKKLGQKPKLTNKYESFRRWYYKHSQDNPLERLKILHLFLAEDGVCFKEDREHFLLDRCGNTSRHRMDCGIRLLIKSQFAQHESYRREAENMLVSLHIGQEKSLLERLGEVNYHWHESHYDGIYPDVSLQWGLYMLVKLFQRCKAKGCDLDAIFDRNNSACQLFGSDARTELEGLAGEPLTENQYEAMVTCLIPCYIKAQDEQAWVTARSPKDPLTINEAIWKQYQIA